MFNQTLAVADSEIFEYATNPVEALRQLTFNQMGRMYPSVNLQAYDVTTLDLTLNRTLQYMLHLDQSFSTSAVFDSEHFDKMNSEGAIYGAWLESEDGTPFPDSLKYSPASVELNDDGEPVERKAAKPTANPAKVRKPSETSLLQRALVMYTADVANNVPRSETLAKFVKEFDMKNTTATVYYTKFKKDN